MLKNNLSYEEWIYVFDKAKTLKSNIVLVGVTGKLIGFDETLSILRVIDIPLEYDLPVFSFMPKDLKPVYDAADKGISEVIVNQSTLELRVAEVNEWVFDENGNMISIYPSIPIITNPFQMRKLYDLYLNTIAHCTNRFPSEDLGNMKNSDIMNKYIALKADDGNLIFRHGNHSLVMFYGWIKPAKTDDIYISFYDIPGTTKFLTKIDIFKSKTKETVTTYTINFNIVSTIPF